MASYTVCWLFQNIHCITKASKCTVLFLILVLLHYDMVNTAVHPEKQKKQM